MRSRNASLAVAALAAGAGVAWLTANRTSEAGQLADAPLALLVGWSFIRPRGDRLAAAATQPAWRGEVFTGFAWFSTFLADAG